MEGDEEELFAMLEAAAPRRSGGDAMAVTVFAAAVVAMQDDMGVAALSYIDSHVQNVQEDKRRGGVSGRRGKKPRLASQWPRLYLGSNAMCGDAEFRRTFGVPRAVYNCIYDAIGNRVTSGRSGAGVPGMPGDLAILYMLRWMRTGLGADQFEDQVGYSGSTLAARSPSCDDDPRFHWWITPATCPPPA